MVVQSLLTKKTKVIWAISFLLASPVNVVDCCVLLVLLNFSGIKQDRLMKFGTEWDNALMS